MIGVMPRENIIRASLLTLWHVRLTYSDVTKIKSGASSSVVPQKIKNHFFSCSSELPLPKITRDGPTAREVIVEIVLSQQRVGASVVQ